MKKAMFVGLVSALILSGVALANQVEDEKKASSVQGTMQQMMGGSKAGEGMGGMGDMMGMMGQMTKMMDQCTAMMGSGKSETQKAK
jgi:hypothetical protein